MIFVNTDLDTAIERDKMRERTVGEKEVTKMWKAVQNNLGNFQSSFGNKMFIVDNSIGSDFERDAMRVYKTIRTWAQKLPNNKAVKDWMDSQR